jgi:hypothetical protein
VENPVEKLLITCGKTVENFLNLPQIELSTNYQQGYQQVINKKNPG